MNARTAFLWSVRRETWEHRGAALVPLIVSALTLVGFVFHTVHKGAASHPAPFSMAASVIVVSGWIVGFIYALDALHGERRDRSILFWKSMPVSDRVTVMAKATMPLVVIPVYAFVVAVGTQLAMLGIRAVAQLAKGAQIETGWPIASQTMVLAYGVAIHALWFAPIFAWLLLVSAWARRAPFLWGVLPVLALYPLEILAFGTSWIPGALRYRFLGAMEEGFKRGALRNYVTDPSQLDPARFFGSPNLWLGLLFAGACLALTIWLRRHREPN